MPRRRKFNPSKLFYAGLVVAFLLVVFLTGLLFLKSITSPVSKEPLPKKEFVVDRGESALSIATRLYKEGLIRSPLGFRYILKKHSLTPSLQSGTYYLSPSLSTYEIATSLTRGISDLVLTIPEGYRLEQIAEVVQDQLGITQAEFLAAAKVHEGYLFPDTYYLSPSSTATELVAYMQDNFFSRVGELDYNTLILASLVERETRGAAEKPVVAGILKKRLESGWPLELDATVQYVLGDSTNWWPVTTLLDRKTPSPYNTYLNQGLPPAPICNPGLASINAARSPQASDYWFYLHDKSGTIRYATTNEQHSANIAKYIY